ncbi:N-acetylglucosamine kinase [Paenibacillus sp. NFR01]|uniref:N-acetylglucosamine kinase n=1 Tax=Paenibacillus sp. NFR01 TaxID=1566279 RepID=UPI0008AFC454|nr:BadF/BadG/BcrA/BcrD ATPase family protein [Paenibacillus sp. NFR01]SET97119.1 glucosamine kinase [Paenibacillus sp. NFR01]
MQPEPVILGIDGGGTHTRVMAADLRGTILSYSEKGSASLYRDAAAASNVHEAIRHTLALGGIAPGQVIGIAAGIAGYDAPEDLEWILRLTDLPELLCPKWHVNDALIAHYGAMPGTPGIIVISGTGSILVAVNEEGRLLRNYDFHHYANSAARSIAYETVYEVLAGYTDASDDRLIRRMLEHWQKPSLSALHTLAEAGFESDRRTRDKTFGAFAPAVTAEALGGSGAAQRVCDRAMDQIMNGIGLLAGSLRQDPVPVACIGSVVNSDYFRAGLTARLQRGARKAYAALQPQLPPVAGAVLYALEQLGRPADAAVIHAMQQGAAKL